MVQIQSRNRSWDRNRNWNRNLSKVETGTGTVINSYGSATLPLRDYLIITHIMVLCRLYILYRGVTVLPLPGWVIWK
jgi:hypothetical protein